MMNKVYAVNTIETLLTTLHKEQKKIVLAGGCFDVLHVGHITFLRNAKEQGDVLLVFLESDETITRTKGQNRPINTQKDRAIVLAALAMVDGVIMLPAHFTDADYDHLVKLIKPAIIATTAGDKNRQRREQQAALVDAKVIDVVEQIANQSTTKLVEILHNLE